MGLLSTSSRGGLLSRRGGALAAVAVLHAVVLVIAVHARIQADSEPEAPRIQVAILQQEQVPPEIPPQLEVPPPVAMAPPPIDVPVVDIPDSQAIVPIPVVEPVTTPPVATPVVAQSAAPVMLGVDEVDYLRMPEPHYPRAAKRARLQGIVEVWVLIDPEGRPKDVRVHRSSGYEQLDREGCDAVAHAQFKPYRDHGVPRSAQVIVPIQFSLDIGIARRH